MNRGSLHTGSFRRIHFSVFRYKWTKSFRGFRETGPWPVIWEGGGGGDGVSPKNAIKNQNGRKSSSSLPDQDDSPVYFIPPQLAAPVPQGWAVHFCRLQCDIGNHLSTTRNSLQKYVNIYPMISFPRKWIIIHPQDHVEQYSFSRFFHVRRKATCNMFECCKITAFFHPLDSVVFQLEKYQKRNWYFL